MYVWEFFDCDFNMVMTLVAKVQHYFSPDQPYSYMFHSLKDVEIAELQQKLDKAMVMLQSMQSGQPAPARGAGSNPGTPTVTPQNKMIPKKASPPCETSAPSSSEAPETPDTNAEARIFFWEQHGIHILGSFPSLSQLPASLAMQDKREQAKLEARLRRLCEKNRPGSYRFPMMSTKHGKLVVSNVIISWRSLSTQGLTR